MGNPFYNRFQNNSGPFGQFANLQQQFNQFASSFQGDPQQQIQQLLDSGKMTQEQYNWANNMARIYQNMAKMYQNIFR